jgi:hypothetical protein
MRFAYRRVSTGNVNIPALLIPQLLQPVRIGILSASYIQDHRDNSTDAHRGFWNTVDAGVAECHDRGEWQRAERCDEQRSFQSKRRELHPESARAPRIESEPL